MSILRKISLGMRIGAIGLVAFSPWLKPTARPSMQQSIMYVVDNSASFGDEDALQDANAFLVTAWGSRRPGRNGEKLGVISFAKHAEVAASLGAERPPVIHLADAAEGGASDLAGAIQLAAAALPAEGHRSIVVLSDFRPTRGDAEAEVRKAATAGIRVNVVPLEGPKPTSAMVTAIHPRATHVAEHQPIAFDVDVSASGGFQIVWSRDGVALPPVRSFTYRRHTGDEPVENQDKTVELVDRDAPPGTHVYEAHAEEFTGWGRRATAVADETSRAASAMTAVSVEGKAYAAVFSTGGDVPAVLAAALKEAGLEARRLPIERAADPATYSGADLVVLSDVRVTAAEKDEGALTRAGQAALVEYVQQGGGLLTTGGVFGLAPEYAGTPIARAIPVEIEDRGHVEDPPVSLAIMLDRSGSMMAQVGGHTKLELALEASIGAAEVLRPTDFVALASVDTETNWDIPLGPQSRLPQYRDKVRTVQPGGGGIYVYTALKDAYKALEPQKTPIRHVILFSDTADSEQQTENCPFDYDSYACAKGAKTAEKLATEARAKGITTTVVGIGDESAHDTPFLRRLAAASGGRFYITEEGTDLRRIFLSETRVLAQSNLREKKVKVARAGAHPALEGVDADALPTLGAYVETGRRSGADTALVLPDGRPMLATWRYGLGKSGALTTDLIEGWGDDWGKSHVAQQVLRQSLRFLLRQSDARRADARVAIKDRSVEVDIELPPDASPTAAPALIDVYAANPGGPSRKLDMKLEQRGPGHWVAKGRSNGEPVIIARARDGRGALMAEAIGREDRAAEITGGGMDMYLATALARTGDGRISPLPIDTLAWTSRPAKTLVATWPYALVGAAFLVMLDLIVRRISERTRNKAGVSTRIDGIAAAASPQPSLRAAA